MAEFFRVLIARRCADPQDDRLSALLGAEIDGRSLAEVELIGFCTLLLLAGNETSSNLIGNAVLCLHRDPSLVATLQSQPLRLVPAIEKYDRAARQLDGKRGITTKAPKALQHRPQSDPRLHPRQRSPEAEV